MTTTERTKKYLRYDEAADFLEMSVQSVRRLAEQGDIKRVYLLARSPRITRASLEEFTARKERESEARA